MNRATLERIDAYCNRMPRSLCDATDCPPFTLFLHRESAEPFLSYARPTAPLPDDLAPALAAAGELFGQRGRSLRFEFIEDLWPELPARLTAAGQPATMEVPLLTLAQDEFAPPPPRPGVRTIQLTADSDLLPWLRALAQAFDQPNEPDEIDVAASREMLRDGWLGFAASWEGTPGAMAWLYPSEGVCEVAGVGTAPGLRRRGLAAAASAAAAAEALRRGCEIVFLTAGNEPAVRVYESIGFRRAGTGRVTP